MGAETYFAQTEADLAKIGERIQDIQKNFDRELPEVVISLE
jgi:hypothetical protein